MVQLSRRLPDAAACYAAGLFTPDRTPPVEVERLLAFCARHDLAMNERTKEAFFVRTPLVPQPSTPADYEYACYVTTAVFLRQCRRSGRWMPGTVAFSGSGDERTAIATCHTRLAVGESWLEVGANAAWFQYYERDRDGQTPTARWRCLGDICLAEVAEVLAARRALGDLVEELRTEEGALALAQDVRVLRRLEDDQRTAA